MGDQQRGKSQIFKKKKARFIASVVIIPLIMLILMLQSCSDDKLPNDTQKQALSESETKPSKQKDNNDDSLLGNEPAISPFIDVKAVYAGAGFSMMMKTDDTLWTWGSNEKGKLGDGNYADRTAPVQVLKDVKDVSGTNHVLALKNDGTLWAWGANDYGQVGDGSTDKVLVPKQVLADVIAAKAGEEFSVALKNDGSLWGWGRNNSAQLGIGTTTDSLEPVKIMDEIVKISVGDKHVLAIKDDLTLWGWGSDQYGQLAGNFEKEITVGGIYLNAQTTPVKLLDSMMDVVAGGGHSMALDKDNNLWTWGDNRAGQLGNKGDGEWVSGRSGGKYLVSSTPHKIMTDVKGISASYVNAAALKNDGSLWIWGGNNYAQIGDGSTFLTNTPIKIMDGVESISLGRYHSLVLKSDRSIWSWGSNTNGELGDGSKSVLTMPVKVMDDITNVATYSTHTLIVNKDGTLFTTGENINTQLGDGSKTTSSTPVAIMQNVRQAAAGINFALCLKEDGSVWSWGLNQYGQLGNSIQDEVSHGFTKFVNGVPVQVDDNGNIIEGAVTSAHKPTKIMDNVSTIAAYWCTAYAIKADNTLWSWGLNEMRQMGDGTRINSATPKKIIENIKDIIPQYSAITQDGTLWHWGDSFGDRSILAPQKVLDNLLQIANCNAYEVILKDDHTLWAIGSIRSSLLPKDSDSSNTVELIQIGEGVKRVAANYNNAFLIDENDVLWAPTYNSIELEGATSNSESTNLLFNTKVVKVLEDVHEVVLDTNHVLIIKNDGSLWAYGNNNFGQLGDGSRYFVPRQNSAP